MESRPPPPPPLLVLALLLLAAAAAVHGQSTDDWFTDEELHELDMEPERGPSGPVEGFRTEFLSRGRRRLFRGQRQYQVRLVGGTSKRAGFGSMVSNCQVGRRGLRDCLHDGLGATAECSSRNVAGVICGDDPSTAFSQVPIRKSKDKRGRRASGAFILAGVECSGRESSLAQCRSVRGDSVRCAGNQFSGAAVECAGQQSRDTHRVVGPCIPVHPRSIFPVHGWKRASGGLAIELQLC
ncbi:hypothetical protein FJT64_002065 [Amphibalanus amphitrite]|uniref:SRCR domain-containing protein n=1 Tax=Amphibalanus amphitrite TaxID=1232801 RepID=A0A6A4X097_AMPAM|nr:hypothetical protein FJT64_002065 [Amphibalanus amphitrite]